MECLLRHLCPEGLSAPDFLQENGPVLPVTIMPGRAIREILEKANLQYQTVQAKALIDSGATSSVITPKLAQQLNLKQTGFQKVASANNSQNQPVYYGGIAFSWGKTFDTGLIACPLTNVDCLIGRDILRYWYFTYDGPNGTIVICD